MSTEPKFPRNAIAHIGTSHFARGHWLPLLQEVDPDIKVTAISLRSTDARDHLEKQNYDYKLYVRGDDAELSETTISTLDGIYCSKTADAVRDGDDNIVIPEQHDLTDIVAHLADPAIQIVTLTITANAYDTPAHVRIDLETGNLTDSRSGQSVQPTTGAVLAAALYRRFLAGDPFPVLMSLDNGEELSSKMKSTIKAFASFAGSDSIAFSDWIENNLQVVDTMVDRIVPSADVFQPKKFAANGIGGVDVDIKDPTNIYTEPWPMAPLVMMKGRLHKEHDPLSHPILKRILDTSPHARVSVDGQKYPRLKIRTVNGAHFALGMLGTLAGYHTTCSAMENPVIRAFVKEYIGQMRRSLHGHAPFSSLDVDAYQEQAFRRLATPYIDDSLTRICRDTITKLQQRLIEPLEDLLAYGDTHELSDFVLVAWTRYLQLAAEPDSDLAKIETTAAEFGLFDGKSPEFFRDFRSVFGNERMKDKFTFVKQQDAYDGFDHALGKFEEFMRAVEYGKTHPDMDVEPFMEIMRKPLDLSGSAASALATIGSYGIVRPVLHRQLLGEGTTS